MWFHKRNRRQELQAKQRGKQALKEVESNFY